MSLAGENTRNPLNVVQPVPRGDLRSQFVGADLGRGDSAAPDGDFAVRSRRQFDLGVLRNGSRQHVTAVVVGVFANQVHAARGSGQNGRGTAKEGYKVLHVMGRSPWISTD